MRLKIQEFNCNFMQTGAHSVMAFVHREGTKGGQTSLETYRSSTPDFYCAFPDSSVSLAK
jgi:hypothetical protein